MADAIGKYFDVGFCVPRILNPNLCTRKWVKTFGVSQITSQYAPSCSQHYLNIFDVRISDCYFWKSCGVITVHPKRWIGVAVGFSFALSRYRPGAKLKWKTPALSAEIQGRELPTVPSVFFVNTGIASTYACVTGFPAASRTLPLTVDSALAGSDQPTEQSAKRASIAERTAAALKLSFRRW
jgi:hypothetical protein